MGDGRPGSFDAIHGGLVIPTCRGTSAGAGAPAARSAGGVLLDDLHDLLEAVTRRRGGCAPVPAGQGRTRAQHVRSCPLQGRARRRRRSQVAKASASRSSPCCSTERRISSRLTRRITGEDPGASGPARVLLPRLRDHRATAVPGAATNVRASAHTVSISCSRSTARARLPKPRAASGSPPWTRWWPRPLQQEPIQCVEVCLRGLHLPQPRWPRRDRQPCRTRPRTSRTLWRPLSIQACAARRARPGWWHWQARAPRSTTRSSHGPELRHRRSGIAGPEAVTHRYPWDRGARLAAAAARWIAGSGSGATARR